MDCDIFISVHNVTKYAIKVGYHANNCDWCDYVLSWRDWYNRISTHAVTSLIWCGTCKLATFQGFVIKWIHNPARNPVSGYKIKWESTKYRSKMAVGTYELSFENWTYGSDETYPKRVLQDFKKVPFFLKIAYFAPLNALRARTPLDLKKQPFYSVFLVTPAYNITLEWAPPPRETVLQPWWKPCFSTMATMVRKNMVTMINHGSTMCDLGWLVDHA